MPFLQNRGVRLHFAQVGRGSELVMVHGLAANLAFWYLHAAQLLADRFRVTMYDLRGHGRSAMPDAGYDVTSMAADLSAVFDELGIQRAHLVGHSYGGAIALAYTLQCPERVRSLTLADAALTELQPRGDRRGARVGLEWRRQLGQMGIELGSRQPNTPYGVFDEVADPRWQDARRGHLRREAAFVPFGLWNGAPRAAGTWQRLLRTTSMRRDLKSPCRLIAERLREVRQPVLVVFGEHSGWLPTRPALMGSLPQSRVVVIPGVGHFFPMLKPVDFSNHLRQFLESVHEADTSAA